MLLPTEPYLDQVRLWPREGRHILAHHDEETVVVYQAYRPSIARAAIRDGRFGGGGFSFDRMSWIKPNFLWTMYRAGWGEKEGQEHILAVRLKRPFFDRVLAHAVPSTWDPALFATAADWEEAVRHSEVRLQWDPDHHPLGAREERRAIQLGLRGATLRDYAGPEVVEILDLTGFAAEQHAVLRAGGLARLVTPRERVYRPADPAAARQVGIDDSHPESA